MENSKICQETELLSDETQQTDTAVCVTVSEMDAGKRLDVWLCEQLEGRTRSFVQKLIEDGSVLLDGRASVKKDKNARLNAGMQVQVNIPAPAVMDLVPENIPLEIVYEDADLLVVNKPKGMVVHPAPGNYTGTLVHALLWHCGDSLSGIGGVARPGIVHRIDKDTSGLLIVAKSDRAHVGLADQIREHSFTRQYEAVVYGNIKEEWGTLRDYLRKSSTDRKKMAVVSPLAPDAREAVTHYEVLERFDGFTHVRLTLETGRTHQIRVQMAAFGHPVAGDPLYGPQKVITELQGQCLHAKNIGFVHPVTGEHLALDSALPEYFTRFLGKLRRGSKIAPGLMQGILMTCDCDGTLICHDDTIPPVNIQAVRRFTAAGGQFALATGRPVPMVERFISQLGITTPCVLFNGGMIYDPVDKRPLWYTEIPLEAKKLALQVMEDFKDAPGGVPGIEIFAPDMIYLLNWHPYMQWHLVDRYPIPHQKATFSEIEHLPWVKFMFVCDEKYMGNLIKYLDKHPVDGVQLVRSDRMLYEVLPMSGGKGSGVERLADMLGVPRSRVVAMGDYENDREMLNWAGFAVVPVNAPPEIQKIADLTTQADNTAGAVAEAIDYLIEHKQSIF